MISERVCPRAGSWLYWSMLQYMTRTWPKAARRAPERLSWSAEIIIIILIEPKIWYVDYKFEKLLDLLENRFHYNLLEQLLDYNLLEQLFDYHRFEKLFGKNMFENLFDNNLFEKFFGFNLFDFNYEKLLVYNLLENLFDYNLFDYPFEDICSVRIPTSIIHKHCLKRQSTLLSSTWVALC